MYLEKGYSLDCVNIILNSLAKNTLQQYNSCYVQWWNFCKLHKADPTVKSIPLILEFLTKKFQNGAMYGTINSMRSALSLLLDCELSTNKDISRFFKGIFRLRPNKPKYNETWDPSIVLDFISNFFPNEQLSLNILSKKLLMLLALTTAQRLQTFSKITIDNISIDNECIKIKVPQLIKTSRLNSPQPLLILKFYEKESICPARALCNYLQITKTLRINHKNLFITLKKPHSPASTHTLSRWIKDVLTDAGIDSTIFTAHSTRHAATSAAHRKGLNINLIKSTAGWSDKSQNFAKFYNLPLVDSHNFGDCILNNTM